MSCFSYSFSIYIFKNSLASLLLDMPVSRLIQSSFTLLKFMSFDCRSERLPLSWNLSSAARLFCYYYNTLYLDDKFWLDSAALDLLEPMESFQNDELETWSSLFLSPFLFKFPPTDDGSFSFPFKLSHVVLKYCDERSSFLTDSGIWLRFFTWWFLFLGGFCALLLTAAD